MTAGFLRYTTWLKLGILTLLAVWALVFRLGSWSHFVPFVAQRPGSCRYCQPSQADWWQRSTVSADGGT